MILSRLNGLRDLELRRRRMRGYRRKIASLLRQLDGPLATVDPDSMGVRRRFPDYRNTDWHVAYATLNGIASDAYLPEDLFYPLIEPMLNNPAFVVFYHDKASLPFLLAPGDCVDTAFFRLRDRYYDGSGRGAAWQDVAAWLAAQDDVVVKPARTTGGGRGVVIGPPARALQELQATRHPVVIQPVLRQHPDLARFNAESLNTIRTMTLRHEGRIRVLSAVLRLGAAGSRVDNVTRGAVGVGIDEGRLRGYAVDIRFGRHEVHPTSQLPLAGATVPAWDAVRELAVRCHRRFLEADLVSWDLAVGADGRPRVVEANLLEQELNGHQILNGPVFAPYLDDLLARAVRPWALSPGR